MRDQQMSQTLTRLTREAGDATMAVYGAPDFDVRTKGDDSPVTEADLAADHIIVAELEAAFPDIAVVTKERADSHDLGRERTHFLVDPLDGREFINRCGDFTVNIALIENGVPVAGIVYAPAIGRLFRIAVAGGAEYGEVE